MNRGLLGLAEAVLAGRDGDMAGARRLAAAASGDFVNCEPWADLARFIAAPAIEEAGWADPTDWLEGAAHGFGLRGLTVLAEDCKRLQTQGGRNPWSALGISARESDVLRLVARGMSNREIATELHLSPRTVEKHVEALLRKAGARSRTELVAKLTAG